MMIPSRKLELLTEINLHMMNGEMSNRAYQTVLQAWDYLETEIANYKELAEHYMAEMNNLAYEHNDTLY